MKTGIALGSNLGDRLQNLRQAHEELLAIHGVSGEARYSRIYETEPVDCPPDTSPYLNAVIEIDYDGDPISLLGQLQRIEKKMRRPSRHPRNAPRTIDLDILYAGGLTLTNEKITIPHPRLFSRRFVLAPLYDIAPGLILPGQHETVAQLLAKLPDKPSATVFALSF
jgi:2-amino-4-hydroxy-6-hydroxymethyldihydropteridine diphosphokinase